jgi:hypothetical protein
MSKIGERNGAWVVILEGSEAAREGDCRDCWYLQGHVSWWCTNKKAVKAHGTLIPGRTNCKFWKEALRMPRSPSALGWRNEVPK